MTDCDPCKVLGVFVEAIPSEVPLIIQRGSAFVIECILTDDEGAPINLTGQTVQLTVKTEIGGDQKIFKENGTGEHEDPENGKTRFEFTGAEITDEQGSDRFYWIYEIRRLDGVSEYVHIQGDFVVEPEIGGGS